MLSIHQYYQKVLEETEKQQIIEIAIPGAGKLVSFETDTLIDIKEIIGIAIINPNPKQAGHGTLRLRIGDTEILPEKFHADLIAKFNHKQVNTQLEFGFRDYIFPVRVKAEGSPVKISYTEPVDGGSGKLYLYLLGKKNPFNLDIPDYRFQVIEQFVPQGSNDKDVEIAIKAKTIQSHQRVVGAMLLGYANRIKSVALAIDETTILPEGMSGQLVTKQIVNSQSISNGIFIKHIIPFTLLIHPCYLNAQNSKIEGKMSVIPDPDNDYSVFLYLLTTL